MVMNADRPASDPIPRAAAIVAAIGLGLALASLVRASERTGDIVSLLTVALLWLFLGIAWLVEVVGSVGVGQWRWSRASVGTRAVVPVVFGLVGVISFSDVALHARFAVSRTALDRMAESALAGEVPSAAWVGLYPLESVERSGATGVRFRIGGGMILVRGAIDANDERFLEHYVDDWSIEYEGWFD